MAEWRASYTFLPGMLLGFGPFSTLCYMPWTNPLLILLPRCCFGFAFRDDIVKPCLSPFDPTNTLSSCPRDTDMGDPKLHSVSILFSRFHIVSRSIMIRSIFDSSAPYDSSMIFAGGTLVGHIRCRMVSDDGVVIGNCEQCVYL